MGLVDVDPLALLPVTAAAASAAYARASDPARDDDERQEQLTFLEITLSAVWELLDSCDQHTARLAAELCRSRGAGRCEGVSALCRRCLGAHLECSAGVGHCRRCGSTIDLPLRKLPVPSPPPWSCVTRPGLSRFFAFRTRQAPSARSIMWQWWPRPGPAGRRLPRPQRKPA
jgi:hypothetical protein